MANVWKIGSRWSEDGSWDSRIISIFRRSGAVFLGGNYAKKFYDEVTTGDYFAIADGSCVTAVAKAISDPMELNDMINKNIIKVRQGEPFDITDDYTGCYGVKVKIVDLPEKLRFNYKWGTFFKANSIAPKVINLFEDNLSTQFDIKARTYRIKSNTINSIDDKLSIIDNHTIFTIPVYQREYSWHGEQVSKFIGDIFKGFWGSDDVKSICMEPMFIGTMQLSYKKYIKENEYEQDVIDGQQRLSTILCILKYLKLKYPQNEDIKNIQLNWLETRVNNGKELKYLSEMLELNCLDKIQSMENYALNRYLKNLEIIKECFEELTKDEEGSDKLFIENIDLFTNYILTSIYFVVVETLAGLSKTIQIFNTINTEGLDLSGNDLFKVRMYEYLHDRRNQGEDAFNEIGDIYKNIKDLNNDWRKTHNWDVITVDTVRSIYKYYLISKYKLNTVLYSKSTDTFFDELFDTLLNVQEHKEYAGVKNKGLEMSISDLTRITKVAYLWNSSDYRSSDDFITYTLIERSRYSRYVDIAYQVLLSNEELPIEERFSEVYQLLGYLSRLFFCYSIIHARSIYEIHGFMYNIYQDVANYQLNKDKVLEKIKQKLFSNNNDWFKYDCLGKPIAGNRTWKDLICVLSDYLDELDSGTPLNKLQNLYEGSYDIEHIYANAISEIDDDLQNSIGNLMVLEYDINRSIGCLPFKEKVNRHNGELCYKDSKYATVHKIMQKNEWTLEEIKQRRKDEIKKICRFLFD